MLHKIAVSTNSYHGFTVDQALEGIAAAGFKFVELTAVRGWTEHIMPEMPEEELCRIENKMKELGLSCVALSGHCNLMDEKRLDDFRKNMALAHRLGCKYIISSTGEAHFGKDEKFADDVLIENIRRLVPDLERLDLTLGLETHGEYGTGESLKRISVGVGSPRVGVNYDTANVVLYGGVLPEEEIVGCRDAVVFVHLKDKLGIDKVWNFPAVGHGELKLMETLDKLEEAGYEGPYSIEIEYTEAFTMREKVEGDLEYVNEQVKAAYDYLKTQNKI